MPLDQDPAKGGTEKDGAKTQKYCSYCYKNGEFVGDFKSAQEMQEFCINMMMEHGMPKWKAWLFTRIIPRLERWK